MIVFSLPATGQQGGKVLVKVHTQAGESIRGARIRVENGADLIAESVTDSNGTAEFNAFERTAIEFSQRAPRTCHLQGQSSCPPTKAASRLTLRWLPGWNERRA